MTRTSSLTNLRCVAPDVRGQTGVIRPGTPARARQLPGSLLGALARQAVDDAWRILVLVAQEADQLGKAVALGQDPVADVRPIEAADEGLRPSRPSRAAISRRVGGSAVAVSAIRGTWRQRSRNASWRYSGRKSWPHCDTQCASSIANSAIVSGSSQARKPSVSSRSGA